MAGSKRTLRRYLIRLPLYLLVFWALGFGLYVMRLPHVDAQAAPHADAIIVLTGGAGRLEAGMDLLARKSAKRLFISGVHPSVVRSELSKLTGADPALFDCCVDLGRIARNTYGNATESRTWVEAHGFHRLILVTADYHMPRSLLLFRHVMPEAEVIAFPVNTGRPLHLLVKEYTKYLFTVVGQLLPDQVYEYAP
ncbi:YdcF family protein [Kordiimonas marina]|uniref:YdcF family protein n=1 Tax=Kordiimonas marina TaxID=2872312 RepID=UPI001FF4AD7D|nr:YdcF family protein [Kordiimonas marina]MCJ9428404.1 YdcF family protein [Kordiimonas marina]